MAVLKYALIAILTAALLKGMSVLFKRSKPQGLSEGSRVIRPVGWIVWLTVIVGAAMVAGALRGAVWIFGRRHYVETGVGSGVDRGRNFR